MVHHLQVKDKESNWLINGLSDNQNCIIEKFLKPCDKLIFEMIPIRAKRLIVSINNTCVCVCTCTNHSII